ncbi:MAG: preprotein translocase subunit SecE [Candidatus Gracilibacteria bacterium]|nr:preprotein translocase subunit SecE [Candidatus Gracilibacteria bacterium]
MIKFFKDSFRELKHVVWPTKEETRNFFTIVLIILVLFGVYLFIANTIFSESMINFRQFVQSL